VVRPKPELPPAELGRSVRPQLSQGGAIIILEKLFYRDKRLFLQSLHPGVAVAYSGAFLALSLLFANPLFLAGLLLILVLALWAVAGLDSWEGYLRMSLGMALAIMVINPLVSHAGATVLWYGPTIPVMGRITVSLEAISYGAVMSVRLLLVISTFCLYNLTVHPDRALAFFSRFARNSTLVASIATRLLPVMARDQASIREAQAMRGLDLSVGGIRDRLTKYSYLINVLLVSSLEDSLAIAESMQARAFGSGPRTYYNRLPWRPRDTLCLSSSVLALGIAAWGTAHGIGTYQFYPHLGLLIGGSMSIVVLVSVSFALAMPAVFSWGWHHWLYLKSAI